MTTSFGVASALSANPSFRIRVCPGEYDPRDGGVGGPDTVSYLAQFRVTHTIIGASRLNADGPSDFNATSVAIKRAMIQQAEQTILVLDHEKLDQAAFERICNLDEIDHLVTDREPPAELARALRKAKVGTHLPRR